MKEKQITTKSRTARQNRTFRLSDYELRKLSEGAKAAGMNESKYVRELIIHGGVDATHAEDRRKLIRQVSGIATNINQMAKHCNETGWFGSTDARRMKEALDAVLELLKELIEMDVIRAMLDRRGLYK